MLKEWKSQRLPLCDRRQPVRVTIKSVAPAARQKHPMRSDPSCQCESVSHAVSPSRCLPAVDRNTRMQYSGPVPTCVRFGLEVRA